MTYSVIMATYNGEKYIEQQLQSIIAQTRKIDEIIICDDCSQDRTVAIIESYLDKMASQSILIVHEKNCGVVQSFLDALEKANCDYVLFCDQDDVWEKNKVERIDCVLRETAAEFLFTNASLVDENMKFLNRNMWDSIRFQFMNKGSYCIYDKGELLPELLKRNIVTGMTIAVKRSLLLKLVPFPEGVMHDSWLAFAACSFSKIVALNEPLVLYRQHADNVIGASKKGFKERLKNGIKNYTKNVEAQYKKSIIFYNWITTNNIDVYEKNMRDYMDFMYTRYRISIGELKMIKYFQLLFGRKYSMYFISPIKFFVKDFLFCFICRIV